MSSLNKVILIGRLGRDPETVFGKTGVAITTLSLATSEKWKDKNTGEQKEETEWHRVKAFSGQAETLAKYTQKGSLLYVEGRLKTSSYTKDGVERYSTDIMLTSFKFLGPKNDSQTSNQNQNGFQQDQSFQPNQQQQQPQQQQNQGFQNQQQQGFPQNPPSQNTGFQPQGNPAPQNHQQSPGNGFQPPQNDQGSGTDIPF